MYQGTNKEMDWQAQQARFNANWHALMRAGYLDMLPGHSNNVTSYGTLIPTLEERSARSSPDYRYQEAWRRQGYPEGGLSPKTTERVMSDRYFETSPLKTLAADPLYQRLTKLYKAYHRLFPEFTHYQQEKKTLETLQSNYYALTSEEEYQKWANSTQKLPIVERRLEELVAELTQICNAIEVVEKQWDQLRRENAREKIRIRKKTPRYAPIHVDPSQEEAAATFLPTQPEPISLNLPSAFLSKNENTTISPSEPAKLILSSIAVDDTISADTNATASRSRSKCVTPRQANLSRSPIRTPQTSMKNTATPVFAALVAPQRDAINKTHEIREDESPRENAALESYGV